MERSDGLHDSNIVDDVCLTAAKRRFVMEILVDIATNVGDISSEANASSFGQTSDFALGNDALIIHPGLLLIKTRMNLLLPLCAALMMMFLLLLLGSLELSLLTKLPRRLGLLPELDLAALWLLSNPVVLTTTLLSSQALRMTLQLLFLIPVVADARSLQTFRPCPLMAFLFIVKRMFYVGSIFFSDIFLMRKYCQSKLLAVLRLWN